MINEYKKLIKEFKKFVDDDNTEVYHGIQDYIYMKNLLMI